MPATTLATFPKVRNDRGVASQPLAQSGAGGLSSCRARIWPWFVGINNGGQRTTVVSPRFAGYVMLYEASMIWPTGANNSGGFAILYAQDDSGAQTAGANVAKPSGTPIFDQLDLRSPGIATVDEIREIFTIVGQGAQDSAPFTMRPRYIIPVSDGCFLKITMRGSVVGEVRLRGYCTIIEAASLEDLQNFP